ncbi:MAG: ASKHA domain-containing protein [Candidatus Rokuibacteriota bacterium]
MTMISVTFLPDDKTLAAEPGASLLRAAHAGGVDITATCGGRGRCTSCRVKFVAGTVPPPTINDQLQLGHDLVREGYRLSCQTVAAGAVTVQIAPPLDETAFQILGAAYDPAMLARTAVDAGIRKRHLQVELPRDEHHQTSDLEEVGRAVGLGPEGVPLEIARTLPSLLRDAKGDVTVTTFHDQILAVERGNTTAMAFGLAVDVGTTSVVTSMLELASGEVMASVSSLNPQAVFGGDLMSRIAFAQWNPLNLRKLQSRILTLLNQQIDEILERSGVLPQWVYKVTVVGNTCMHHMLLGIDPTHVGLAPYAPVLRHPVILPARALGLRVNPEARVCFLPIVAGFVGADAVAVALATRIYESPVPRAVVDIGTNGEVIMGTRERLMACSAPAGPALEAAQIRHGMRGAVGAIDRVWLESGTIRCHVIGEGAPQGICGSGLIDAMAVALEAELVDWTGLIQVEAQAGRHASLQTRLEMRGEERVLILVPRGEGAGGGEIVLSQDDVRQIQLAKGAIASGIRMLQRVLGVSDPELAELMLAGGFGNYLSIPSAARIGLIPPLPLDRIRYVGNAAALGAQVALVSESERARAAELARTIGHVSLAAHPDFQDLFVDSMNFPRA